MAIPISFETKIKYKLLQLSDFFRQQPDLIKKYAWAI